MSEQEKKEPQDSYGIPLSDDGRTRESVQNYTPLPGKGRWFASRGDYGRFWSIVHAREAESGVLTLCRLVINDYSGEIRYPHMLGGAEPASAHFTREEAQELMDGLWESGLRPSRG